MKKFLLRETFFIYLSIKIFLGKIHHHKSGLSDDPPSQEHVLQSKCLDLLPVFCFLCEVHIEQ